MLLSPLARRPASVPAANPCSLTMNQAQRSEFLRLWGSIALLLLVFSALRFAFDPPNESSTASALVLLEDQSSDIGRMRTLVKLSPAVAEALKMGKPVVALESTVVTHGG